MDELRINIFLCLSSLVLIPGELCSGLWVAGIALEST